MAHTIILSFEGSLLRGDPNPLPERVGNPLLEIKAGETVTWRWDETAPGQKLFVVFAFVADLDANGAVDMGTLKSCSPMGPLSSLVYQTNQIVGTLSADVSRDISQAKRYFYKIVNENGVEFDWANPVQGKGPINGGGIDDPRRPP